jgi:L-amino acid N-acyltransferase YncA
MLIRTLGTADAVLLQACRLQGLVESPEAFLVTLGEVADTPLSQLEAELHDDGICYVGAFNDDGLVGFMRYLRFQREARRHVAEVRSVYVSKSARGQGIGARLLQRLIGEAKVAGIETLILSVLEDNLPARRLYESCGFRLHGTEPRAVKKGDNYLGQSLYSLDLRQG